MQQIPEVVNADKNRKPSRPLVVVEWDDSQSNAGWHHETDLNPNYELPCVYTVGFIVQETEKFVCVQQSMIFYEDVSNQMCGSMTIPRGCIRAIKKLRQGGDYVPKG